MMTRRLLLALCLLLPLRAYATPNEVIIGIGLPPEVLSPYAHPMAAAIMDITDPVFSRTLGLRPSFAIMSHNRLKEEMRRGRIDIGYPIEEGDDAHNWLIYSAPLMIEQLILVVPRERPFDVTPANLRARQLGGRLGGVYPELEGARGLTVERFDSFRTSTRLLLAGRLDAIVVESQSFLPTLSILPEARHLTSLPVAVGSSNVTVAFGRHRFTERDVWRFNLAITRMMDKPYYEQLLGHYNLRYLDTRLPLMKLD
jgi:hypothetical protein